MCNDQLVSLLSSQITYENIQSINAPSSGGSGGVLCIHLKQKHTTTPHTHGQTCIYLKAGLRIAAEAYAGEIAHHIDVHSPDFQLIERDTAEWEQLKGAITNFLGSQNDESDAAASLLVFDILTSGRVIACVSGIIGTEFLSIDRNLFKTTVHKKQWIEIGTLIGFDMIINNSDRLPSPVWENFGNGGNVIFETLAADTRVVGIDHTPVMLTGQDREDYAAKLKITCIDLFTAASENTLCANRVAEFIHRFVKFEMDNIDRSNVSMGMIAVLKRMIEPNGLTVIWLEETRRRLEKLVENDPVGVWKDSMASIDISFLECTLSAVRNAWETATIHTSSA